MGLVLLLFSRLPAQTPSLDPTFKPVHGTRGPATTKGETAKWVWTKRVADNQWITLTHDLDVQIQPNKAKAWIAVDNYYDLSVDDKLVAQTKPNVDGPDEWKTAKQVDITKNLTPGHHQIKIHGNNTGGPAGILFRLELDNKPALLSDTSWAAKDDANGTTGSATIQAAAGAAPWGGDVSGWPVAFGDSIPPYLKHLTVAPVKIASFDALSDPDELGWQPTTENLHLKAPKEGQSWQVVLDFGKELPGRAWVRSANGATVALGTGESAGEATKEPYTKTQLDLKPKGEAGTRFTAFRYLTLKFPKEQQKADLQVTLDHLYYPVTYRGSFHCSDPLIDQLWYTGALTAHNCMQDEIWDAPKRDRQIWMGDMHVSGEVINDVFLDKFLMEETLGHLREMAQGANPKGQLPQSHVNGIPGYSCSWLCGMADFYKHTGDLEFIKSEKANIASLMDYFQGELGPNGIFENKRNSWNFVDWSPGFDNDSPTARAATHLFLIKAIKDGAFLLKKCGDPNNAKKYENWANQLKEAAKTLVNNNQTYGDRRQENAMAIYAGVATKDQKQAIYDQVLTASSPDWKNLAAPYYNNYVIFALGEIGQPKAALDFARNYWGGMVKEGATTFWELYDPSWEKHNAHAHMKTGAGGSSYALSLCHGWSAGVTSFLTEQIAGVRPTDGGFSECEIQPQLGDLTFVEATVPTPNGIIDLKAHKNGNQTILDLDIPREVKVAHISVPGSRFATGASVDLGPGRHRLVATK